MPTPRLRRAAAPLLLLSVMLPAWAAESGGAAASEDPTGLAPIDVFALEWASSPRVAPDGKTVAYVRRGFDVMKDRGTSRIWLINTDGSQHRPLASRQGSAPRWSPSGDRLAFLSSTDEGTEIYMHWRKDSRSARITQLPESPGNLTWSPDGRWLAFNMFVPNPPEPLATMPKAPEGATWAPALKTIERLHYRADGQGYLEEGFTHVFVVPAEGGTPRQVTGGDFNHDGGLTWNIDGTALYVSANRREDWEYESQDGEIYRVDLKTGAADAITERYGPDYGPTMSPNGRYLAYAGHDDKLMSYANEELYLHDLKTGETRSLTADLDRSVANLVWDHRSSGIYFRFDDNGVGKVAYVTVAGKLSTLADDLGGESFSRPYTGGSLHAANGVVAYTRSAPGRPAELAMLRRGTQTQLTNLNADSLDHKALADVEEIRFASNLDEREIQAWVAKPAGFDPSRRYPVILEIHGGPFAAYGPHFSAEVQLMAAAGYVVVYVNPRGSTSYGTEFANLIHHAYPGGDFHDLMTAVDYGIDRGWADPERLFVTGGSGGGILTAWIVTQTDRFKAAVSAKPVINWYSMMLTTDAYGFFHRYWFSDYPWNDPEAYLSHSPLHFVDQVSTPTMLLTGERDLRTPITEAEQFSQALKLLKIDTALVRVPEASHGIAARPSHLIAKVQHILAWFERYDKEAE
jgi:dipeptidyl aminopeptidase/acylaminoacyl peptidase